MQILSHLFYSHVTDKCPAMEITCLQFDNREGWFHGHLGATGFCLFWKKPKAETMAHRKPPLSCPMGEVGKLCLGQRVQWWAECQNSPSNFSKAVRFQALTGVPGMGADPEDQPLNVASIFPCKAPWSSAGGKVGHWNTLIVLLQKSLTYLDLPETGGWTQWLSEVPCKLQFASNSWCLEGAEHSAGGAYSLPASGCLTAPHGIDKCRNNWELAAKQDMAVPQEWEHPVSWEIILVCPAGLSPTRVGGPGTYTLYCTK